jgi:hypothetical protein
MTNGHFDIPAVNFLYVTASCTGVATCTQAQVGLTPGSSISGPVTISVSFDSSELANTVSVPEPSTWALMITGVGLLGAGLRAARRSSRLATA